MTDTMPVEYTVSKNLTVVSIVAGDVMIEITHPEGQEELAGFLVGSLGEILTNIDAQEDENPDA
jgi:hypothetical protein